MPDVPLNGKTAPRNRMVLEGRREVSDLLSRCKLFNALAPVQTLGEAYGVIQGLETEDAEYVIRCKHCKHYQFADNRAFGFPVKLCEWTGFEDVDDEDFCSRGERKDGEAHD